MQLAFYPLLKLAVFSVMANTVAAVSLPEPVGLEARQTNSQCLLNLCNPGAATTGCCANSTCSGVSLLGLSIGLCTLSSCNVICSKTSDCCTNIPGTTFSCELLLGQSIGVCIPQIL